MLECPEEIYNIFYSHGISEAEVRSMTETEFQMTLNALLDDNSPRDTYQQTRPTRQAPAGNNYQGTTLPDGFGNGSFDEDEAYRRAIEASIDDMLTAPHLRPRPSPQNEVGIHHRPSSNMNSHTSTNYAYRNEPTNYPPRPNPKPTPLPSTKTPRTNEYSKYTPKERAPSCSHPRPSAPQHTTSQATKKNTSSGTSKYQTKTRPATTSTTSTTNSRDLIVTNSKPKISSNAPIAGTTIKKTQKTSTTTSHQPSSNVSSGGRQSTKSTTRTTTTSTKKTPGTSTTTTSRTTTTTRKTNTQSSTRTNASSTTPRDHSTRASASLAAGDTIIHSNRQSSNATPRGTRTSQKSSTSKTSARSSAKNVDDTNNLQHKPKHNINPTFPSEAIADPTPEILHPKYKVEDPYDMIDHQPILRPSKTKANTNSNYSNSRQPPSPPESKPKPPPKEEKPPETRFSESQILRNIQDMEFIMATQEAERKEREEAEKKAHEEMLIRQEKAKKESQLDEAKRLFKSIPPEPQNGVKAVTIAAQMPNSKRVMRKFAPDTKGIHVYAWVSGQTLDLPDDEKLFIDSFELLQAMGQATELDKNKTLEEQKISGKVLLYVSN